MSITTDPHTPLVHPTPRFVILSLVYIMLTDHHHRFFVMDGFFGGYVPVLFIR
jgi:hypothetical protein